MSRADRLKSEALRMMDRECGAKYGPMRDRDKFGQKLSLKGWES
jgi:hypothetical protein